MWLPWRSKPSSPSTQSKWLNQHQIKKTIHYCKYMNKNRNKTVHTKHRWLPQERLPLSVTLRFNSTLQCGRCLWYPRWWKVSIPTLVLVLSFVSALYTTKGKEIIITMTFYHNCRDLQATHFCSIVEVHSDQAENDPDDTELHVSQENWRRGMFQQLLEIDAGETRHHAGSADRRKPDGQALFGDFRIGDSLCRLKLDYGDSGEKENERKPLESTQAFVQQCDAE